MRTILNINENWTFLKEMSNVPTDMPETAEVVNLPHTWNAKDGQDGKPGIDGAAGVTPNLKIEEGYWYVSFDGGKTWETETLGQATGDRGDSIFKKVSYDDNYVYITMADGQQLTLPRASASQSEGSVGPATIALDKVTATTATFAGHLNVAASDLSFSQVTVLSKAIATRENEFTSSKPNSSKIETNQKTNLI